MLALEIAYSNRMPRMQNPGLVIDDIARLAGASTATVSRVLTGSRPVSPALRERVLSVIRETGYTPDATASGLARRRVPQRGVLNRTIAFAMSDDRYHGPASAWSETYYHGILEAAEEMDLVVTICTVRPQDLAARVPPPSLLRARCGAIVMAPIRGADHSVLKTIAPVVMAGSYPQDGAGFPVIQPDNRASIFHVVEHLYGLGHRRFDFVAASWEHLPYAERYESFAAGLARYELPVPPARRLKKTDFAVYAEALASAAPERRPTAIVAATDSEAVDALTALRARGLRTPEDVSVVGFDGRGFGAHAVPPLTTWRVDWRALGRIAVRTVVDVAEGRDAPQEIRIGGDLLVRASTGPAPSTAPPPRP